MQCIRGPHSGGAKNLAYTWPFAGRSRDSLLPLVAQNDKCVCRTRTVRRLAPLGQDRIFGRHTKGQWADSPETK
jgi:hypothetical protein